MITVYNFPRGARGLRLFWQCEEMGLPYRAETISFPTSAAYRELNPLGTVPFLTDDGGGASNQALPDVLFLPEPYGPPPVLPGKEDSQLARVLQMTVFGEATIAAGLNPLLAAHFMAPEADKRNWSVRAQQTRIEQALNFVAHMLGDDPFLAGANLTLA